MAAENVGAAARFANVTQSQLQDAGGTHDGVTNGVLGLAHAPHHRAGATLVEHAGHFEHLGFFDTTGFFHLVWRPLGQDFFLDFVHAKDTVIDVLLVLPAILENVVQDAKHKSDVRAGSNAHIFVSLGCGAGETRIHHNHLATVLLGVQHVQHTHRVRLGGVGTNVHGDLAVLHVVVGVGHGAITPSVGHTGHGGGVANARLVIAVVGTPKAHKLAQQVGLLVVVLGGPDVVNAVWAAGLFQL